MKTGMKRILIILIISVAFNNTIANCQNIKVKKINFFYLPWDLRTQYDLSSTIVRDFNKGGTTTFTITNDTLISEFMNTLSIFNLRFFHKDTLRDFRMVIDIYFSDNKIKTLYLDTQKLLLNDYDLYYINLPLLNFIEKYLPIAEYPKKNKIK